MPTMKHFHASTAVLCRRFVQWYDKLSVPLHEEGRDDAQMFEEARKGIEKHFEIRRVFDIPESRGMKKK